MGLEPDYWFIGRDEEIIAKRRSAFGYGNRPSPGKRRKSMLLKVKSSLQKHFPCELMRSLYEKAAIRCLREIMLDHEGCTSVHYWGDKAAVSVQDKIWMISTIFRFAGHGPRREGCGRCS